MPGNIQNKKCELLGHFLPMYKKKSPESLFSERPNVGLRPLNSWVLENQEKLEDFALPPRLMWAAGAWPPAPVMDGEVTLRGQHADVRPQATDRAASWSLSIFYHVRKFILRKHIPSEFTP